HGVVAANGEKRYALIISLFVSWVLAIADCEHLCARVEIVPRYTEDLFLAHCCRDRELDHAAHGNNAPVISIKMREQLVQLVFGGTPVALISFADQTKLFERRTRQLHLLDRNFDAVNGCCVADHKFNCTEIDTQGDGPCSFFRAVATKSDQSLTIKL